MHSRLADKVRTLPDSPGVYLMKNASGEVIYIGKAKSLRERVRQYVSGSDTRAFVALLDTLLDDLEVVLTGSDKEAFILENELIKLHSPRFNIKLTDDKRFLCLRLDTRQAYPRLQVVRRFQNDGVRYFGPYHSATALRETLRLVNRHFQLRTCSDRVMHSRTRPCLQYQIKRCPAPCVFDLQKDGVYQQHVGEVAAFLEGRKSELLHNLQERMRQAAAAMAFESAAVLRDQIHAVQRSLERQSLVSAARINRDVIGIYREGPLIEIHVMRTRDGRPTEACRFSFEDTEVPTGDVLSDFAASFYSSASDLPSEILFPNSMEWGDSLALMLSERHGRSIHVQVPQRGAKLALVELAQRNASQAFSDKRRDQGAAQLAMVQLQNALQLANLPRHLECYDISHLQGSHIVASGVCLLDGVPHKAQYRRYKIRTLVGQDDFKAMYEVISRRARRGLEEGELPDLLVIDGGKGQLHAANEALRDHGVDGVDVVGLAKARLLEQPVTAPHRRRVAPPRDTAPNSALQRSCERVFVLNQALPVVLRQNSAELFLLTRARDEAHRFAITFHRQLRGKAATRSALDGIPGIGPQRRRNLLRTFGSVRGVAAADAAALAKIVGSKLAAVLQQALLKLP